MPDSQDALPICLAFNMNRSHRLTGGRTFDGKVGHHDADVNRAAASGLTHQGVKDIERKDI